MLTYMDSVGDRLRRARAAADISQDDLAKRIGATRSAIAQVESGISGSLNAENLVKAAHVLGKSANWLATGEGPEDSLEVIAEAITALPPVAFEQTCDLLIYNIEKASPAFIKQDVANSYVKMIERLKDDMVARKKRDPL